MRFKITILKQVSYGGNDRPEKYTPIHLRVGAVPDVSPAMVFLVADLAVAGECFCSKGRSAVLRRRIREINDGTEERESNINSRYKDKTEAWNWQDKGEETTDYKTSEGEATEVEWEEQWDWNAEGEKEIYKTEDMENRYKCSRLRRHKLDL